MDIRLEGVRFARSGRYVLSVPELSFRPHRTTAVLGPNGAGKTSLLRLIAGLDRPDSGRVFVGGEIANIQRRCVAYMFQENVFLRRSLLENLTIALTVRGVSPLDAHRRATEALERLDIAALGARRADRISGGEARRASLARALSLGAPVLLLDEPMSGLDGGTYARLRDDLPAILRQSGATTVLVTHDPEEALRLCDDLVVLVNGEVMAAGTKDEVATNPRRVDVADVLGYSILTLNGRRMAVPGGAIRPGEGTHTVRARVESTTNLVHEWDVIVTYQGARLHVRVPHVYEVPAVGVELPIHLQTIYEVT